MSLKSIPETRMVVKTFFHFRGVRGGFTLAFEKHGIRFPNSQRRGASCQDDASRDGGERRSACWVFVGCGRGRRQTLGGMDVRRGGGSHCPLSNGSFCLLCVLGAFVVNFSGIFTTKAQRAQRRRGQRDAGGTGSGLSSSRRRLAGLVLILSCASCASM